MWLEFVWRGFFPHLWASYSKTPTGGQNSFIFPNQSGYPRLHKPTTGLPSYCDFFWHLSSRDSYLSCDFSVLDMRYLCLASVCRHGNHISFSLGLSLKGSSQVKPEPRKTFRFHLTHKQKTPKQNQPTLSYGAIASKSSVAKRLEHFSEKWLWCLFSNLWSELTTPHQRPSDAETILTRHGQVLVVRVELEGMNLRRWVM